MPKFVKNLTILGKNKKKGENCIQNGLKGLKIASFGFTICKKFRGVIWENDRNAQYIPLYGHIMIVDG